MLNERKGLQIRAKGYGLLEIALGIGIAAIIIAGSMLYYQNAQENRRQKETLELVMDVRRAVDALWGGQSDHTGMDTASIAASGQIASKWIGPGNSIKNPYRGSLFVYGITIYGDPRGSDFVDILLTNVSKSGCTSIAQVGHSLMNTGLVQIVLQAGASIPSSGGVGSFGTSTQDWLAMSIAACNSNSNVVRFSYRG